MLFFVPYFTRRIASCPCEVPEHHRNTYQSSFDYPDIYPKFQPQTLFYIFYNFGGTRAQYFAALALKKREWRFHTQLNTWCVRSSAPHVMEKDYEQGAYIIFDFEKFVQNHENNFKFEYRYLEDKNI
ncbi:CCR4-NOT transcription complex subunit 3 [Thelohanellus kitauei]|uniref:CCR4-NOT transcription complex subunit 3 n=1 Tax=Thelohanellus kitauei TaxID=669202 RepID=A0A0C2MMK7_THEKT|nr:CCR4-NOT transcription complex subunit 3 [Thelohanellus kitauei]